MTLFEVAVITKLTKKEAEEGTGQEVIVVPPTAVLAKDAMSAALKVLMGSTVPKFDLDRVEVLTRTWSAPTFNYTSNYVQAYGAQNANPQTSWTFKAADLAKSA